MSLAQVPTPVKRESAPLRPLWVRIAGPVVTATIAMVGTAYIAANNPHVPGGTYVCPLFAFTGLYCPGCGGTRAVYDLAQGDVVGALSMNPVFTLAVPLLAVLWLRWIARALGAQLRPWPFPDWAGVALPAVFIAFFVFRNWGPLVPMLSP